MSRLMRVRRLAIALLILSVTPKVYPQKACNGDYPNAPTQIVELVKVTAQMIVGDPTSTEPANQQDRPDELGRNFTLLMVYTIADALADIRNLKVASIMVDTARTDKQIGASKSPQGTTSSAEKPGFADLLGIAVENGAIQQQVSGTSLTLSTSPYAFLVMARGKDSDTAAFYHNNEFFDRFGVSANFNLSNAQDVLANARRRQLNEWSARVRLFGNHSSRSAAFIKMWDQDIRPLVHRRLEAISGAEAITFADLSQNEFRQQVYNNMKADLPTYLKSLTGQTAAKRDQVTQWILCRLYKDVFSVVADAARNPNAPLKISPATIERIRTEVVKRLQDASDALVELRAAVQDASDALQRTPLLTFAYAYERPQTGSNYSVYKLLYDQGFWRPATLTVNVGASTYQHPDPLKNQRTWRDISAAISLEGKANSPFSTGDADLSKITYSINGSYERLRENEGVAGKKADLAAVQFKVEIPIKVGVSIPLSVTYANATELIKESHVRGNFGISFDVDKLFSLTRSALKQ